jgi:hypothetical protein
MTLLNHRRDASLPSRLPLIILRTLLPPLDLHPLHPLPRQPLILPLQPLLLPLHHIQLRIQRENLILRVLPKLTFLSQLRRSVLDPALELVFGVLELGYAFLLLAVGGLERRELTRYDGELGFESGPRFLRGS